MIADTPILLIIHHEHARYRLCSQQPCLTGHLAVHLELSGQMTGMLHPKSLINLVPLSIAGQIDWHALRSQPFGLVVPFQRPKRSSGYAPLGPLTGVDHCVPDVGFLASTQVWHARWDHNHLIRSQLESSTWKTTTPFSRSTLRTCLTTRRRSLSRQWKNSKRCA